MAETKDDIAAERDQLAAQVKQLQAQLAAGGGARVAAPTYTFALTEGDRQELELYGVATIGGKRMTVDQARAAAAEAGLQVQIDDPAPELDRRTPADEEGETGRGDGIRGFDFIYPSVRPGEIDPAVAGTPGINGPAAADVPADTAKQQQA